MKRISTAALRPGMITAEDVYSYNNQLILPKGLILTDKTITKLEFYSIISICVEEELSKPPFQTPSSSYSQRIKESPEFKKFKAVFEENVEYFRNVINDVIEKGATLDADDLLTHALTLVSITQSSSIHILDLLHNMREYDDGTYVHSLNVALISNMFARWLRFSETETNTITLCGLLHDIGKTLIPEEIIKKPFTLTANEFCIIKTHTQEGFKILKRLPVNEHVRQCALLHHERCDGTGYPFGLTSSQIDLYARLVSIVDVYDAMTSARIYRDALCPFEVIGLFETEGLQKYDTQYILTFMDNIVNTYLLNRVRLSNGMEGDIVYINRSRLSSPTVKCGNRYIDLSVERNITIEAII